MISGARSDRWNAVFLKELRQALRGRTFALTFPVTVLLGVGLAIAVLVDAAGRPNLGPTVFLPIVGVLGVAALGLVPFSAFQSMAGEWDESTHDLLVLSHLSPMRIVLGKLLTGAVESALYVCAFLPLLFFTFLLTGVSVIDVVGLVALLFAASLAMSCLAMALAGVSRAKMWRVILLALLAGVGFLTWLGGFYLVESVVQRGRGITSPYMLDELGVVLCLILFVGWVGLAFAATRIAHPEDDRSGPVRIAVTAAHVVALLWLALDPFGSIGRTPVLPVTMAFGVVTACFAVFFVTEPDRLPRRAAARIPKNPVLAVLATPFLPGGGRGVLWWLLQLAILFVWAVCVSEPTTASTSGVWDVRAWSAATIEGWAALMAYFLVYLAGFSLALTGLRRRSYGPLAARLILPSVAVLSMVLPILIGFLVENKRWSQGEHALMPFWVATNSGASDPRRVAIAIAILVLVTNAQRLVQAVQEVFQASRARRTRAAQREEVAVHAA